VSIDGGAAVPVDYYRATYGSATVWSSGVLAPGAHTVTVTCLGQLTPPSGWTRVSVDAVDVRGTLVQAP
jgi:hypothetical protein